MWTTPKYIVINPVKACKICYFVDVVFLLMLHNADLLYSKVLFG